jgi:hypothetical protein
VEEGKKEKKEEEEAQAPPSRMSRSLIVRARLVLVELGFDALSQARLVLGVATVRRALAFTLILAQVLGLLFDAVVHALLIHNTIGLSAGTWLGNIKVSSVGGKTRRLDILRAIPKVLRLVRRGDALGLLAPAGGQVLPRRRGTGLAATASVSAMLLGYGCERSRTRTLEFNLVVNVLWGACVILSGTRVYARLRGGRINHTWLRDGLWGADVGRRDLVCAGGSQLGAGSAVSDARCRRGAGGTRFGGPSNSRLCLDLFLLLGCCEGKVASSAD